MWPIHKRSNIIIILSIFASAALPALTMYGLKMEQLLQTQQAALPSNTLAEQQTDATKDQQLSQPKVSYVTSFWAERKGSPTNPHRRETKAALLANIHNPHFDQVVVFLDGVSDEANCAHFLQEINNIQLGYGYAGIGEMDPITKLACVDIDGGQPSYYQMFQNTLHEAVTGDIVVLSNADQAFDETISLARSLNPEVLAVLGTRGFSDKMPPATKSFYEALVSTDYTTDVDQKRPGVWDPDLCYSRYSWDTWIFHKSKLNNLKEEHFQRFNTKNERESFYMNENGAENAALWAFQQSYPFMSLYNACDRIHSWHFHLTPKTHKERTTPWLRRPPGWNGRLGLVGSVPPPYGGYQLKSPHPFPPHPFPPRDPECVHANNCFLSSN
jgi:hypothetical protein